jgi:hypothetical protein
MGMEININETDSSLTTCHVQRRREYFFCKKPTVLAQETMFISESIRQSDYRESRMVFLQAGEVNSTVAITAAFATRVRLTMVSVQ